MEHDHRRSVSVAGVVIDNERRALVTRRRDNGRWEAPGGVLEHGETIEAGVRREVWEETGLKIDPERLTGVYQNMTKGVVALVFRCRWVDGDPTPTDEVTAFKWVTAPEAWDLMAPAYAARVVDALQAIGAPAVRWHDGTHLL